MSVRHGHDTSRRGRPLRRFAAAGGVVGLTVGGLLIGLSTPAHAVTDVYDDPAGTDWTVPLGVRTITVTVVGATGGNGGGAGAQIEATLAVSPGDVLTFHGAATGGNSSPPLPGAGGSGYRTGGDGGTGSLSGAPGGGGGGASAVLLDGAPLIVAAGGGGGGGDSGLGCGGGVGGGADQPGGDATGICAGQGSGGPGAVVGTGTGGPGGDAAASSSGGGGGGGGAGSLGGAGGTGGEAGAGGGGGGGGGGTYVDPSITATITSAPPGAGSVTVVYEPLLLTTTTVTPSSVSSLFGEPVSYTVAVDVEGPDTFPPGTVTLTASGTALGSLLLTGPVITFLDVTLPVGDHTVTATFTPSATGVAPSSGTAEVIVRAATTTTTVTPSVVDSVFGQPVSYTVAVDVEGPAPFPPGSVSLGVGATFLGQLTLAGGEVTFLDVTLPVGAHTVTATFQPSGPGVAVSSGTADVTVSAASTTTSVVLDPPLAPVGEPVALTASVSSTPPGGGSPVGEVVFIAGSTVLGAAPVVSGQASLGGVTLPAGQHIVTASFTPSSLSFAPSNGTATLTVGPVPTTTAIVQLSPTDPVVGQEVTATVQVEPSADFGEVGGVLELFQDGQSLGTVDVVDGVASLTFVPTTEGSSQITAEYGGSTAYQLSTSDPVTLTVAAAPPPTTTSPEPPTEEPTTPDETTTPTPSQNAPLPVNDAGSDPPPSESLPRSGATLAPLAISVTLLLTGATVLLMRRRLALRH